MKGKTKNILIIVIPVSLSLIVAVSFTFFITPNVEDDNLGSYFELVDPELSIVYIFGLDKNFSVNEIVIYDHNGTKIFRGDLNNESLLNTTLYLELTLKEFIGIYAYSLGSFDRSINDVFIQVADQLKE